MNVTYIMLIWELIGPTAIPAKPRRNMRIPSIATLCVFGIAALIALKYAYVGLGLCICCLVVYLRPKAPGAV